MSRNRHQRLKSIGLKVSQEAFERLRALAELSRKPVAEWCRDKILEAIQSRATHPGEYAIMAELTATQSILIDLLCALGHDGKLGQQKAQAVVDAAHSAKYKEAAELLKYAYAQFPSGRLDAAHGQSIGTKR